MKYVKTVPVFVLTSGLIMKHISEDLSVGYLI
jgi:hypothetical protein